MMTTVSGCMLPMDLSNSVNRCVDAGDRRDRCWRWEAAAGL